MDSKYDKQAELRRTIWRYFAKRGDRRAQKELDRWDQRARENRRRADRRAREESIRVRRRGRPGQRTDIERTPDDPRREIWRLEARNVGMVDAARIGQTEKGPIMDSNNNEQTEILRGMWKDMLEANKTLNAKIGETNAALTQTNAALSDTNATLRAFMQQTHENFGRVHRNFDKVNTRLEHLDLGTTRVDDLDARLTRVETHVGLRED